MHNLQVVQQRGSLAPLPCVAHERRSRVGGWEGGLDAPDNVVVDSSGDNSRADRSNIVFMNTMSENIPMDMLGFTDMTAVVNDYAGSKTLSMAATLSHVPCAGGDAVADADCWQQIHRLAYLNQQSDGGSLVLRRDKKCLTEVELDAIKDKNLRENHPLNCAKLNAKPYPYFDGGVMMLNSPGKFAYFSSRNNNFSNRDQTGIVCVRRSGCLVTATETCGCDLIAGVLQDQNTFVTTAVVRAKSYCNDEASDYSQGNNFGSASCITVDIKILDKETRASTQADNDSMGDGNKEPCEKIEFFFKNTSVAQKVGLAVALLFVGMFSAWGGYFAYNRYMAISNSGRKFGGDTKWKDTKKTEMI